MTEILRRGVDYSTRPSSWGAFFDVLKSRGYTVLGRYLSSDPKGATVGELVEAWSRGFSTFFYYETREDAPLEGYERGVAHAQKAIQWLRDLGIPEDLLVYYAVDRDFSTAQMQGPVAAYFRGVLSEVGSVDRVGCYGGYYQVRYLLRSGLASKAVQTEAWSYLDQDGNVSEHGTLTWYPGAGIRQWTNHGPGRIGGISCDGLDIVAEDIAAYHPEGEDELNAEDKKLLRQGRLSDVARSYDVQILRAEIHNDFAKVARLEAEKAAEVAKVKEALGLTDDD